MSAGDTIVVADGSYLGFTISELRGAAGAPITIEAPGGAADVLRTTDHYDNAASVLVSHSSYVELAARRSTWTECRTRSCATTCCTGTTAIALFRIDGAEGPRNVQLLHNTVDVPSDSASPSGRRRATSRTPCRRCRPRC